MITSASVAVTLSARRKKQKRLTVGFGATALVFTYTTVLNIVERPDGLRIAFLFILGIVAVSAVSRVGRSFEIRATDVTFDRMARSFINDDAERGVIRIVAHEPDGGSAEDYRRKNNAERRYSHIPRNSKIIFLEVLPADSSEFEEALLVEGSVRHGFRVLTVRSGNIPNTLAAVLLEVRNLTGLVPHAYFEWTEGNPVANMLRFLFFGSGEVAPVTREVLREAERDAKRRPVIHVS